MMVVYLHNQDTPTENNESIVSGKSLVYNVRAVNAHSTHFTPHPAATNPLSLSKTTKLSVLPSKPKLNVKSERALWHRHANSQYISVYTTTHLEV